MIGASQPLHIYSYRIFLLHVKSVSAPVEAHITNRQKIIPLLILWYFYQNADIRLGLHPYDHMPQYKVLKVFIYVWQRSDMSMKWVRCSYHNLQYIASEKPRELPTSTLTVRPSISGWGCILMTTATVEGAETHYICMRKICHEYEVDGVTQQHWCFP